MAITYATWNPSDKGANAVLSNGNLTDTSNSAGAWADVRSTIGVSSGKWYWECTATTSDGFMYFGIANSTYVLQSQIFSDSNGWGYTGVSGKKANGAGEVAYGSTWTQGDVIGVALDMNGGTITFYKNNVSQGQAFSGLTGTIYALVGPDGSGNVGTANFGATALTYTPPSGYNSGLYSGSATNGNFLAFM